MKKLNFIKSLFPDKEPKPLAVLENAKTRCEKPHGFFTVRYDLKKEVKSIGGWVENPNGERTEVIWNSIGAAYVSGERVRKYDLVITESFENVC